MEASHFTLETSLESRLLQQHCCHLAALGIAVTSFSQSTFPRSLSRARSCPLHSGERPPLPPPLPLPGCHGTNLDSNALDSRLGCETASSQPDHKTDWSLSRATSVAGAPTLMARLTSLPCTLLARVLRFLDLPSRCVALLTCRHLARAGADPLLWEAVDLPRPFPSQGLSQLLDIPRFSLLRSLHLQDLKLDLNRSLVAKLLRYIESNTNLASIDLSSSDLSAIPAFPLAESLSRVGRVRLSCTRLTLEQATTLLRKIGSPQARRTHTLDLSFNDLRFLEASLIVAAVKYLSSLDLSYTDLGDTRTMEVMEGVANSQIESLDLSGCGLARTSLDSIGLNQKLASLTLTEVTLNPDKLDPMLTNLSLVRNLQYLDLSKAVLTE